MSITGEALNLREYGNSSAFSLAIVHTNSLNKIDFYLRHGRTQQNIHLKSVPIVSSIMTSGQNTQT